MTITTHDPALQAVRMARAYLARVFEPGTADGDVLRWLADRGPVLAAELLQVGGAPAAIQARAALRGDLQAAERDLARAAEVGARLVIPEDEEWPAAADTASWWPVAGQAPPIALWVRGTAPLSQLLLSSVAIVGSRASTAYGEHVAAELAHGLAQRDWVTVSGGAFGIDAAAHRGAIAAGKPTVAVLACGVDRVYPSAHTALFDRIVADGGLLVSEFPPGSAPLRHRFLTRNRLVAGLTVGTVVVESAARSGTLTTARRAAELGRPVMAVPGPVTSAMSVGCHQLLRAGDATVVTGWEDVVERLGSSRPAARDVTDLTGLTARQRTVLAAVPVTEPATIGGLARVLSASTVEVQDCLHALEARRLVRFTAGEGWRARLAADGQ